MRYSPGSRCDGLDHQLVLDIGPAHRRRDFVIGDRYDLRLALAQDVKRDRRHARGLECIAQRRRGVGRDRDDRATRQRARHIVPAFGLGTEDPRVGAGERDPRCQAAPADRNRNQKRWRGAGLRQLVENFEADTALARDDMLIVEARHQSCAALGGQARGDGLALFGAAVVEDDGGALGPGAVDFELRRVGGHDDRRGDAQAARGDRHALRVIARRKRHHTPRPFVFIEQQQAVGRAPQLECAAGLEAFAFQPHPPPAQRRFDKRCAKNLPCNPRRSGLNI